jgi:Flp pilus assembly protein TadG
MKSHGGNRTDIDMRTFLNCNKGNFAVAFSLALLPVLGAAGMATDYARAVNVRSFLQSQT